MRNELAAVKETNNAIHTPYPTICKQWTPYRWAVPQPP